jgi:hypothetical protein
VSASDDQVGVQIRCQLSDLSAGCLASYVRDHVTERSAPQATQILLKRRELIGDHPLETLQSVLDGLRDHGLQLGKQVRVRD